jgi:hypothetical protein
MFERFVANFSELPTGQSRGTPWLDPRLQSADGYSLLAERFAGCTFENGLYRLHDQDSGTRCEGLIAGAFPDFAQRVCPFGYDWLGRQFALDAGRVEDQEALVLMMEPGTGQALEIPMSFAVFHEELDNLREPALAAGFFIQWAQAHPDQTPLAPDDCVGYRVPLFLGGKDLLENLETINMEIYWSICGQLRLGTRRLPTGATIRQIDIAE